MSEPQTNMPELSLLEQLKMQHASFVQQKELAQNNLNQLVGAVYACEVMIQKHEQEAAKQSDGEKEMTKLTANKRR
jgi:hypothetical protein